jgi:hypothetical protein
LAPPSPLMTAPTTAAAARGAARGAAAVDVVGAPQGSPPRLPGRIIEEPPPPGPWPSPPSDRHLLFAARTYYQMEWLLLSLSRRCERTRTCRRFTVSPGRHLLPHGACRGGGGSSTARQRGDTVLRSFPTQQIKGTRRRRRRQRRFSLAASSTADSFSSREGCGSSTKDL